MRPSKHNIISKITDSDNYFVVNILSKQADILTKEEVDVLLDFSDSTKNLEFVEKGYISNPQTEDKIYRKKYLEFIDNRDTDEVQLFYVPTYKCNFACSYCYQDEYGNKNQPFKEKIIDSFFSYIDNFLNNRKKYITVFGGEPLLDTSNQRTFFKYFIEKANLRSLDLAIVTNGYNLKSFIDVLKTARLREIQVTLDGTAIAHNRRRMLKGGKGTFDEIVAGIDKALENRLPVNLRMVIDKENINELPALADFAINKGWASSPYFKTQLGRNYELHHCQSAASMLYSRIDMYKDIYHLLREYPQIEEFHKPSFSISKFLFEEGKLPDPLFDSCPGTKTEWAFDFSGRIYSCTATVGKPGEELGTFFPSVVTNDTIIEEWQDRDVLSIEKCRQCELQLACGGGCASVAKNNNGVVKSPDCRPIKELLELGIAHYFKE